MKKNAIFLALCLSLLGLTNAGAKTNDNDLILNYFKSQVPPQVKVTITDTQEVKELPKFKLVTIKLSDGKRDQEIKMFSQGEQLFPDIIDLKSKTSLLHEVQKKAQQKALRDLYTKEDKANIISLGNDPKKETLVIFTDPECPYCRRELKDIENRLKTNNVKLLITTVHGKSSLQKAHLIYDGIKKAKGDDEKIKIMRKYYASDVNLTNEKIDDKRVEQMDSLRKKYLKEAIKGVPFIINEKEIK
ncbi:MAG: histidine kinase [Campylobacteraceae bacterium]|nr:histidine kinase [Campylobacteraceae bacterium]